MKVPTQLYRDYFINHEIRIPKKTSSISMERTGVGSGFLDIFAHMDPEREKQFTVEK